MKYNNRNSPVFWSLYGRRTSKINRKYTSNIFKQSCYSSWHNDHKYSSILYSYIIRENKESSDNYNFDII